MALLAVGVGHPVEQMRGRHVADGRPVPPVLALLRTKSAVEEADAKSLAALGWLHEAGVPPLEAIPLAALAGARLVGGRVTTQYDAAAAGLVIGQSPGAAASVPAGTTVALVVSRGPQPKLVPNVAGRPLSAAGPALTPSGFSVGAVSYVYSMQVARGDIVIAIVDGQFTLKRLDLEQGSFVLRPENKAYPVIRPEGMLEIFGVMVGLVRKL